MFRHRVETRYTCWMTKKVSSRNWFLWKNFKNQHELSLEAYSCSIHWSGPTDMTFSTVKTKLYADCTSPKIPCVIFEKHCKSTSENILFRHPRSMLKSQLRTSYLFLTQVNVLSELCDCIQRGVMLKTQPADLQNVKMTWIKMEITHVHLKIWKGLRIN